LVLTFGSVLKYGPIANNTTSNNTQETIPAT